MIKQCYSTFDRFKLPVFHALQQTRNSIARATLTPVTMHCQASGEVCRYYLSRHRYVTQSLTNLQFLIVDVPVLALEKKMSDMLPWPAVNRMTHKVIPMTQRITIFETVTMDRGAAARQSPFEKSKESGNSVTRRRSIVGHAEAADTGIDAAA